MRVSALYEYLPKFAPDRSTIAMLVLARLVATPTLLTDDHRKAYGVAEEERKNDVENAHMSLLSHR